MGFLQRWTNKSSLERTAAELERRRVMSDKRVPVMWLASGASLIGALTSISAGLVHVGVGLSVSASMAFAAIHLMDDRSENGPPRLLQWLSYLLLFAAAVCLIAGWIRH